MITAAPVLTTRRPAQLVDGEFGFTAEDFRHIADALYGEAGIVLADTKATLVYSRLTKRLRALGLDRFSEYVALIDDKSEGAEERRRMVAALTTNVTRFFREPHHFEHLKTEILPRVLDSARKGGRVRFWSAGCSTGQEPYSIALCILSMLPEAAQYDIKILATDIDPNVIATGKRGVYAEREVDPIPRELRQRWMVPVVPKSDGNWQVGDDMRALVSFRELNLMGNWPIKGPFEAIFCRNVVIYFEEATQSRIWGRFMPLLGDEGWLYIGHSERVPGDLATANGGQFRCEGLTTYRVVRRSAAMGAAR